MDSSNYQPPVDRLLTFGDCHQTIKQWPDYIKELSLDEKQIPDLITMTVDKDLDETNSANFADSLTSWAPVHAWRALGQLQACAAIEPLLQLFHKSEDNDLVSEEMPKVYGMIGAAAIPALAKYLADSSNGIFSRITAVNSLEEIANHDSNSRVQSITVLAQQLKSFHQNPAELSGFVVASLINLKAIDAASIIKAAFAAQAIPEDIVGSWEEVKEALGVTSEEDLPPFQVYEKIEVTEIENIVESDVQVTSGELTIKAEIISEPEPVEEIIPEVEVTKESLPIIEELLVVEEDIQPIQEEVTETVEIISEPEPVEEIIPEVENISESNSENNSESKPTIDTQITPESSEKTKTTKGFGNTAATNAKDKSKATKKKKK
ncbi:MAG: HEAT repeat domain-containing protein [Calothrix sp. SM1_7_51]|nr:HEAT repeat domain-containing protein [Calothrix sp. SM1_7_51]